MRGISPRYMVTIMSVALVRHSAYVTAMNLAATNSATKNSPTKPLLAAQISGRKRGAQTRERFSAQIVQVAGVFATGILMWLAAAPSVFAEDASNWDGQTHSAARLIAGAIGKDRDTTFLRAGIEIKLDPGWQTYWRDPGDSGAPPTFDFSGSDNVKSIDVLWPAPEKFADGGG